MRSPNEFVFLVAGRGFALISHGGGAYSNDCTVRKLVENLFLYYDFEVRRRIAEISKKEG